MVTLRVRNLKWPSEIRRCKDCAPFVPAFVWSTTGARRKTTSWDDPPLYAEVAADVAVVLPDAAGVEVALAAAGELAGAPVVVELAAAAEPAAAFAVAAQPVAVVAFVAVVPRFGVVVEENSSAVAAAEQPGAAAAVVLFAWEVVESS
jgi:hypothetical protein